MKKAMIVVLFVGLVSGLAGCEKFAQEDVKEVLLGSVQWYRDHPGEIEKQIAYCEKKSDPSQRSKMSGETFNFCVQVGAMKTGMKPTPQLDTSTRTYKKFDFYPPK